jgi:O-succinylbenzoate synthase
MIRARWLKHHLKFRFNASTSRGVLNSKYSYYIILKNQEMQAGIGECGPLKGLSLDDRPEIEEKLNRLCNQISTESPPKLETLGSYLDGCINKEWPSLKMGLETAFRDLLNGGDRIIFKNGFITGREIPINGLIWMGNPEFMMDQIDRKIQEGYRCIKMKIGAIDFQTEINILKYIRNSPRGYDLTIRVDANGAFTYEEALRKLEELAGLGIHSIEQPIAAGQPDQMERLCRNSKVPIALDEELIGCFDHERKEALMERIKPAYIVLKPTLLGGFLETQQWIDLARAQGIEWWITSALESNIGLNAIAQFTLENGINMEQGLGTGQLYMNNIPSPLEVKNGFIIYNRNRAWDLSVLNMDEV